jgi:hypothetical protein
VCNAFGFTVTIAHYPTGAHKAHLPIAHEIACGAAPQVFRVVASFVYGRTRTSRKRAYELIAC